MVHFQRDYKLLGTARPISLDHQHRGRESVFDQQLRIESTTAAPFATAGDSGCLILEKQSHKAVGLFFSGGKDDSYALANPIQAVLDALEIEFL